MQTKQPFTIGGSVALKKALVEETGIRVYHEDSCALWNYLVCETGFDFCGLQGIGIKQSTHYQLPQDWDKAVAAVKDFFAEEPKFEKGKWYYGEQGVCTKYLFKFLHVDCDGAKIFSEAIQLGDQKRVYYFLNQQIDNTDYLQPATQEQIQEMLGKVAESKGFVKSIKVRSLFANNIDVIDGGFNYELSTDSLWSNGDNNLIEIYNKGKWAELVPQEEPKPETLVLKGVKVIEQIDEEFNREHFMYLHLTAAHLQQLQAYFTKKK
jgi:hypothetical protein